MSKCKAIADQKKTTYEIINNSLDGKWVMFKSSKGKTGKWAYSWLSERLENKDAVTTADGLITFNYSVNDDEIKWAE